MALQSAELLPRSSWPGLARPSTPCRHTKDVDARVKPAHDGVNSVPGAVQHEQRRSPDGASFAQSGERRNKEIFVTDAKLIAEMKRELIGRGVEYCLATYVDVHGAAKAKTIPVASFEKMAGGSELFTVGAMEGMGLVGPQEDECAAVPDLASMMILPWDKRFAWFASDLYYHDEPYANCSRVMLKRVLAAAKQFTFNIGVETEFYVLRKVNGHYKPIAESTYQGICPAYDVDQTLQSISFLHPMVEHMRELGWGVYSFDQEGGRGQYEFDFAYGDALTLCDRLIFMRIMAKQVARALGAIASFMPKPFSTEFRSGAHYNMSLADAKTKSNLFDPAHSPVGEYGKRYNIGFPDIAFQFTAGLLAHAPALTALSCPTFNSYKGLVAQGDMADMSWAPVLRCYGRNNRSAMLRLPMNRYCVENRAPDISTNFYLTAAFSLAAGMEGITRAADPGAPWNENLYALVEGRARSPEKMPERLPRTLIEALDAFGSDPLIAETFGVEFRDIYLRQKTREWERGFYKVSDDERAAMMEFI
jgi:glutamine synthetase